MSIRIRKVDAEAPDKHEQIRKNVKEGERKKFFEVVEFAPEMWTAASLEQALEMRAKAKAEFITAPPEKYPAFGPGAEVKEIAAVKPENLDKGADNAFLRAAKAIIEAIKGKFR